MSARCSTGVPPVPRTRLSGCPVSPGLDRQDVRSAPDSTVRMSGQPRTRLSGCPVSPGLDCQDVRVALPSVPPVPPPCRVCAGFVPGLSSLVATTYVDLGGGGTPELGDESWCVCTCVCVRACVRARVRIRGEIILPFCVPLLLLLSIKYIYIWRYLVFLPAQTRHKPGTNPAQVAQLPPGLSRCPLSLYIPSCAITPRIWNRRSRSGWPARSAKASRPPPRNIGFSQTGGGGSTSHGLRRKLRLRSRDSAATAEDISE